MWKRQVWILAEPDRFLIVMITGPVGSKTQLDQISQAVLETLELSDPKAALAAKEESLNRGREFLAALSKKKLAGAISSFSKNSQKARWGD